MNDNGLADRVAAGNQIPIEKLKGVPPPAIHFKRFPKKGIHWRLPDGVYFTHGPKVDKRIVQVVSVGQNPPHPNDVRAAFNRKTGSDYRIVEAATMQPNDQTAVGAVAVLSRGFYSVIMKLDGVTDEQAQDVLTKGKAPGK